VTAQTFAYSVSRVAGETLERAQTATEARPRAHTPRRLPDVAATLSRVGLAAASAELCNAALQALARLAYEVDTDGRRCNVDIDGRLLVPAPMGRAGHKYYGLRRRESDTLRACLLSRMTPRTGAALPLFVYDNGRRSWYVNMADYPTEGAAVAYTQKHGVSSREYKQQLERLQTADRG
jgi:hypothetical protein